MEKEKTMAGKALLTKQRIMEAARQQFIECGYEGTTLREVAKRANVTTGAFYKYFASKDEILILLFIEGFQEQWKHFYDLKGDFTPKDYIEMDARMNKGIADNFGYEMLRVYFSSLWTIKQEALWDVMDNAEYNKQDFLLITTMAEKYGEGVSPEKLDEIILTVERGVFFQWILSKGEFDIEEATRELLTLTLKGILTKFNGW